MSNHVFISYVHENQEQVDKLCTELTNHGIKAWLDRNDINPGMRWKQAIKKAISEGTFFIACFSREYNARIKTFMNKELEWAIEELIQYSHARSWFIPVKLSECEIPDRRIGAEETLQDLQYVDLYIDWEDGIQKIISVIQPEIVSESKILVFDLGGGTLDISTMGLKKEYIEKFDDRDFNDLKNELTELSQRWAVKFDKRSAEEITFAVGQAMAAEKEVETKETKRIENEKIEAQQEEEENKIANIQGKIKEHKESLNKNQRLELREKALGEIRKTKGIKEELITDLFIEAKENEIIRRQLGIEL